MKGSFWDYSRWMVGGIGVVGRERGRGGGSGADECGGGGVGGVWCTLFFWAEDVESAVGGGQEAWGSKAQFWTSAGGTSAVGLGLAEQARVVE